MKRLCQIGIVLEVVGGFPAVQNIGFGCRTTAGIPEKNFISYQFSHTSAID